MKVSLPLIAAMTLAADAAPPLLRRNDQPLLLHQSDPDVKGFVDHKGNIVHHRQTKAKKIGNLDPDFVENLAASATTEFAPPNSLQNPQTKGEAMMTVSAQAEGETMTVSAKSNPRDDVDWPGPRATGSRLFLLNIKICDPTISWRQSIIPKISVNAGSVAGSGIAAPPAPEIEKITLRNTEAGCDAEVQTFSSFSARNYLYHVEILTTGGSGMGMFSWATVTNTTHVIWETSGTDFSFATGVYIRVDEQGTTRVVGQYGNTPNTHTSQYGDIPNTHTSIQQFVPPAGSGSFGSANNPANQMTSVEAEETDDTFVIQAKPSAGKVPSEPEQAPVYIEPTPQPTPEKPVFTTPLPQHTIQALEDRKSPQSRAVYWLKGHPALASMEEWRRLQFFALVTFYFSFRGDDWPFPERENYLSYNVTDACQWGQTNFQQTQHPVVQHWTFEAEGNQCHENGQFRRLRLFAFGDEDEPNPLKGTLPPEITFLSRLQEFELYRTWWDSSFSDAMDALTTSAQPEFLDSLQSLHLEYNYLKGTIPPSIARLQSLVELDISDNSLTGPIPSQFGRLTSLEALVSVGNGLEGTLPSELGLMSQVKYLNFYLNDLTGTIPTEFGQLTNATGILLMKNQLSGTIPSQIGLLTNLKTFAIGWGNSGISGTIPAEICALPNLWDLRVPWHIKCPDNCGSTVGSCNAA